MLRAVIAAAASLVAAPVSGRPVAPVDAPAAWIAYAGEAQAAVAARLNAEQAQDLRTALATPGAAQGALALKIWIDRKGVVTRTETVSFDTNAAVIQRQLEMLLVGQQVAGRPPKNLRLPLRLAITLES